MIVTLDAFYLRSLHAFYLCSLHVFSLCSLHAFSLRSLHAFYLRSLHAVAGAAYVMHDCRLIRVHTERLCVHVCVCVCYVAGVCIRPRAASGAAYRAARRNRGQIPGV